MMDRQELLNQSYQHVKWALSNNGNLNINRKTQYKIRRLNDYGLEDDEILNNLFVEYLSKNHYEKYDPDKSLSTFAAYYTYYNLNNQIRKQRTEKKNYPKISLDSLAQHSSDGYCGSSISFLNELGANGLVEYTTPEDLVIAMELLELIYDHFGEDDAEVILGFKDRRTEAERLSIRYDTYCKRLSRKICTFLPVLKDAGYC